MQWEDLLLEAETEEGTRPKLQKEVEQLQKALEDLRTETDERLQAEKRTAKELNDKLTRGEALLERANVELKDRDAKAKACEKHLQRARAEINELVQQRQDLKYELDIVHRELKHSYKFQTSKELDKLARNIPTFNPNPAGGSDVHSYLQDIDFHLQTVANVTTWDKLYLLRITSGRDVRSFLDRQPETVKMNYTQLRQALIREFSDPESDQGIIAAMDLKQARLETPQAYYGRLRQAYFGPRNEADMEEDVNFKTLFLRNLHPSQSAHLGVPVCPRTMSIQQLRDLAHKAYVKQKTVSDKTVKYPTVCPVSEPSPEGNWSYEHSPSSLYFSNEHLSIPHRQGPAGPL
ncbi:hypothetical protein PO909_010492 [Leuciscus waleckii]